MTLPLHYRNDRRKKSFGDTSRGLGGGGRGAAKRLNSLWPFRKKSAKSGPTISMMKSNYSVSNMNMDYRQQSFQYRHHHQHPFSPEFRPPPSPPIVPAKSTRPRLKWNLYNIRSHSSSVAKTLLTKKIKRDIINNNSYDNSFNNIHDDDSRPVTQYNAGSGRSMINIKNKNRTLWIDKKKKRSDEEQPRYYERREIIQLFKDRLDEDGDEESNEGYRSVNNVGEPYENDYYDDNDDHNVQPHWQQQRDEPHLERRQRQRQGHRGHKRMDTEDVEKDEDVVPREDNTGGLIPMILIGNDSVGYVSHRTSSIANNSIPKVVETKIKPKKKTKSKKNKRFQRSPHPNDDDDDDEAVVYHPSAAADAVGKTMTSHSTPMMDNRKQKQQPQLQYLPPQARLSPTALPTADGYKISYTEQQEVTPSKTSLKHSTADAAPSGDIARRRCRYRDRHGELHSEEEEPELLLTSQNASARPDRIPPTSPSLSRMAVSPFHSRISSPHLREKIHPHGSNVPRIYSKQVYKQQMEQLAGRHSDDDNHAAVPRPPPPVPTEWFSDQENDERHEGIKQEQRDDYDHYAIPEREHRSNEHQLKKNKKKKKKKRHKVTTLSHNVELHEFDGDYESREERENVPPSRRGRKGDRRNSEPESCIQGADPQSSRSIAAACGGGGVASSVAATEEPIEIWIPSSGFSPMQVPNDPKDEYFSTLDVASTESISEQKKLPSNREGRKKQRQSEDLGHTQAHGIPHTV